MTWWDKCGHRLHLLMGPRVVSTNELSYKLYFGVVSDNVVLPVLIEIKFTPNTHPLQIMCNGLSPSFNFLQIRLLTRKLSRGQKCPESSNTHSHTSHSNNLDLPIGKRAQFILGPTIRRSYEEGYKGLRVSANELSLTTNIDYRIVVREVFPLILYFLCFDEDLRTVIRKSIHQSLQIKIACLFSGFYMPALSW